LNDDRFLPLLHQFSIRCVTPCNLIDIYTEVLEELAVCIFSIEEFISSYKFGKYQNILYGFHPLVHLDRQPNVNKDIFRVETK
jgi:hypothetical protein